MLRNVNIGPSTATMITRRSFTAGLGVAGFATASQTALGAFRAIDGAMRRFDVSIANPDLVAEGLLPPGMPVHWQMTHNRSWRWVQREHFIDGEWQVTGMTTPIHRVTGEAVTGVDGYLPLDAVPTEFATTEATIDNATIIDEGIATTDDIPGPDAAAYRKARHGRPPSRWLRTLDAGELSIWLATVDPPEAGVSGMTHWVHLTRDHGFNADLLEGLSEADQAKLHGAAHFGY